ncbi:MAG: helix-turn-helix transcriptional regulator [Proteobacteria bacterium]|nr:helix-turn-helix transcriptional regulator [Pseudomonadota bacterium]
MTFELATTSEIGTEIGQRLQAQRLAQNLTQAEVAARAGVSKGTVQNLESKGQATLESLVKVVMALGLVSELSGLFVLRATSIKQLEAASAGRKRARTSNK